MKKIVLPFTDLSCTQILEAGSHFIELHKEHLLWVFNAKVNHREDEDSFEWQERLLDHTWLIKKDAVKSISMDRVFNADGALWSVKVYVTECHDDLTIYYRSNKNALAFFGELSKYFLNHDLQQKTI